MQVPHAITSLPPPDLSLADQRMFKNEAKSLLQFPTQQAILPQTLMPDMKRQCIEEPEYSQQLI